VYVAGSISPWVECIVISLGASHTTTVDYNTPMLSKDSGEMPMTMLSMSDAMESPEVAELIVSFSSVEHDGLGRYGDPLNPNGDRAAMKELYLKLKPGGYLLLAVPISSSDQVHLAGHRQYGPNRLPLLLKGWNYRGVVDDKVYGAEDVFDLHQLKERHRGQPEWQIEPVVILQKPHDAPPTLEELYGRQDCEQTLGCVGVLCGNCDVLKIPKEKKEAFSRGWVMTPPSGSAEPEYLATGAT